MSFKYRRLDRNNAAVLLVDHQACELHRDWRNDIEGLGALFSNHLPSYRNLITSYSAMQKLGRAHE